MSACWCEDCSKEAGRYAFCKDCRRQLREPERWMIRMADQSPMHAAGRGGHRGFGGSIDGSERMRVYWTEEGAPCWTTVEGAARISEALAVAEYVLVLRASAAAITKRRRAVKARAKARNPTGWMREKA